MAARVVVIGATGRIGRPLCRDLTGTGHAVSVFSRDPARARRLVPQAADYVRWSPDGSLAADCLGHLAAADAVVYLAGGPLFDGHRHTRAEVEAESRAQIGALGRLTAALGGLDRRPGTLVAASSVGYYGFAGRGDEPVDEASPQGADWWGADSASIEQAALAARRYGVRTVFVRMGLGAITDIIVRGKRVLPAKVTGAGYQFRFPSLGAALHDITGGEPAE